MRKNSSFLIVSVIVAITWCVLHLPAIIYGTNNIPLHVSYLTADEQSPVNGALHVLQSKSILGLQNQNTLYYGPVIAMLAVPAVLVDFGYRYVTGQIAHPLDYKNVVVWDWGGILIWARFTAVIGGLLGIVAMYLLFSTRTLNPTQDRWLPWIAACLLASNYLFFEYSGAFRHWVFMVTLLLWQFLIVIRTLEAERNRTVLWVWQVILAVCSFGISYLGLLYQVFWIPVLYSWWKKKNWLCLKEWGYHVGGVLVGMVLMILWHPYGFLRTFGLFRFVSSAPSSSAPIPDVSRVSVIFDSFLYNLDIILINNIALVLVGIYMVWLVRNKVLRLGFISLVVLFPALANFFFFSIHAHNESRYMLPTVVLLVVLVLVLYSQTLATFGDQCSVKRVCYIFFITVLGVGMIQILGLVRMQAYGPPERALILPQIHAWQREYPGTRTLVVKNWPLGYVHTEEAYEDYINRYDKRTYELWQYILIASQPHDIEPINVFYKHQYEPITEEDVRNYDHVVLHYPPQVDSVAPESPQDVFDLKPWTVWNFVNHQETYTILK